MFHTVFAVGLRDRQEPGKKPSGRAEFLARFFIRSKTRLTGGSDAGFVPVPRRTS